MTAPDVDLYHRQNCAHADRQCIKNELTHYCLREKETAALPKSVYCGLTAPPLR